MKLLPSSYENARLENNKVKMVDKRKIIAQNSAFAQYGQSARNAGQRHRFQTALL
jgi:hypothetical protein